MLICCSNVIQRDNVVFAKRLDKSLAEVAKNKANQVRISNKSLISDESLFRPRVQTSCGHLNQEESCSSLFLMIGSRRPATMEGKRMFSNKFLMTDH